MDESTKQTKKSIKVEEGINRRSFQRNGLRKAQRA
jgi:hypothetical protein